jgi:hypothetical protein
MLRSLPYYFRKLKNSVFLIITILALSSCRSLDVSSCWNVPESSIPRKLLPLEKLDFNSDKFLQDHVDRNICETTGEKFGYLRCIAKAETRMKGFFLSYFTGLMTLGGTWLLGVPFCIYESEIELDLEVLNNKSERIAKLSSYSKTRVPAALYHGYSPGKAAIKSQTDAINSAYQQIRDSLSTEVAEEINSQLRNSGKLTIK